MQNGLETYIANSDEDKAEVLAEFFSSVFTQENTEEIPNVTPSEATQNEVNAITQEEVNKLLMGLHIKIPRPR